MVFGLKGQVIKRNLLQANSLFYKQSVYVYGYEDTKGNLAFKCFSYSTDLKIKDSIEYALGKHSPSDYLEINADTMHNVLNFYFQLADQKNTVSLLRVNDKLSKICDTKDFDANHVNSLAAFDDEKFTFRENLYVIRTNTDTAGKQFYLTRFKVQSMVKPFEYDQIWQFAFERKFIHRASVMYADSNYVIVYAHVFGGIKKGQWLLKINANTGQLIKGTKLNPKGDQRHFLLSNMIYDKKSGHMDVIGSIYNADMIDFQEKKYNFLSLSKFHKLFLISIDSTGEVEKRSEKLFALPLQLNTGKSVISYHIKVRGFNKINSTDFDVWADLYELVNPTTLAYYSSWHIDVKPDDVDYAFTPSPFMVATKAIPKFISFEKGDSYGKFFMNDIGDYDKFKYQKPMNPVVIKTALDDTRNSYYILRKINISNATKSYNYVFIGKKGLENKIFLKSEQGQKANVIFTKGLNYLSFTTNAANSEFELKQNTL